jgi:hypothetical protein
MMSEMKIAMQLVLITGLCCVINGIVIAEVNVPSDESSRVLYDPRATSNMDDLATPEQTAQFAASLKTDWTLFAEDRSHSIRRHTGLPKRPQADSRKDCCHSRWRIAGG